MKAMWFLLRHLVRNRQIKPAYARQIMQLHASIVTPGLDRWFRSGWRDDSTVFGCGDDTRIGDTLGRRWNVRSKDTLHSYVCR